MEVKLNLKISLKIENNEEMIKFINKKIEDIDQILVEYSGEENRGIVEEYVKNLDSESGGFCQLGMWKIKTKLCPETTDPPTAKNDKFENLITMKNELKQLYLSTYSERLPTEIWMKSTKTFFI